MLSTAPHIPTIFCSLQFDTLLGQTTPSVLLQRPIHHGTWSRSDLSFDRRERIDVSPQFVSLLLRVLHCIPFERQLIDTTLVRRQINLPCLFSSSWRLVQQHIRTRLSHYHSRVGLSHESRYSSLRLQAFCPPPHTQISSCWSDSSLLLPIHVQPPSRWKASRSWKYVFHATTLND